MDITIATIDDLNIIMEIIEKGRKQIAGYGIDQWQNGSPNRNTFLKDIENNRLYVLRIENEIKGVFAVLEHDYSYDHIDGKWQNDSPYVAIHRVCVSQKGLGSALMQYLKEKYDHIRIDTHAGNIAMNQCLKKNGFQYCGVIVLSDEKGPLDKAQGGGLRNAYEYVKEKSC